MLQHLPSAQVIECHLAESIRVLKVDRLLVLKLPSLIPLVYRLPLHSKAYVLLRRASLKPTWLDARLGVQPMRTRFVPEAKVGRHLATIGAPLPRAEREREDWGADLATRLRLVAQSAIPNSRQNCESG